MPKTKNYLQLSRDEELEHFRRWREEGDRQSYETLVESQLPWARRLLERWTLRMVSDDFDIAESAAHEGVLHAIEKFDPSRGCRLTTLVAWAVRTYVDRRDTGGPIRLPLNRHNIAEKNMRHYRLAQRTESISTVIGDEANHKEPPLFDDPLKNLIASETREAAKERVEWAMQQLPERLREVLRLRYWEGLTLKEVGAEFGLTRSRAAQLEQEAFGEMASALSARRRINRTRSVC